MYISIKKRLCIQRFIRGMHLCSNVYVYIYIYIYMSVYITYTFELRCILLMMSAWEQRSEAERWGDGVETQKNVRGEIGGWGRVPFNETYAPSLSTIYDGA